MSEQKRLSDTKTNWKHWGPYLSERAWGTVREDYSAEGDAWDYFPHDHARSKAYRWGEDGLAAISDAQQYLCFGLALWNGEDAILKERLFGLTGPQGNHGEDVKEYYFYLDSTPTHSYMKMLYKYPQRAYPYRDLINQNAQRGFDDFEYELLDTDAFHDDRYFDVQIEYAKQAADDIVIQITVTNRGNAAAPCVVLPTLWFRNTWSWGYEAGPMGDVPKKPAMTLRDGTIIADHPTLGRYHLYSDGADEIIFTENNTNKWRLYGTENETTYVKDGFHRYIVHGAEDTINPAQEGTKVAAVYRLNIAAGDSAVLTLRLSANDHKTPFKESHQIITNRLKEADAFYNKLANDRLTDDEKRVQRQAFAGMLWSKQLYYYDIDQWLKGDPGTIKPPQSRKYGRNSDWQHLNNFDIISMPDKWEYPWYAGWDLAFHCIPLAMVDMAFAKHQLILLTHEWYMHPNGQLPAYEWKFGDVNPPVHAWAAWRIYEMDGQRDTEFLKRIFNKMLLNFTWWVNRKDADDNNVFQGGFLGLDNISLFDRSATLPTGGHINQSDGTAWMGFYCLEMMSMALELAKTDAAYEDMAIKFYEHFLWIAQAISGDAHGGIGLWDHHDNFFYDVLQLPGHVVPLKVRSLVGLMPLIAVETIGQETLDRFNEFSRSINWLTEHRPKLAENLASVHVPGYGQAHLFAMPTRERLRHILRYMLDEDEFLSEFGIRSLSKAHEDPYQLTLGGQTFSIAYWPSESRNGLFGGNSNWRGPIWFPINYLLIEALYKYHRYYGDDFTVECPTGSGQQMTLEQVAQELSKRLSRIFLRDDAGKRPVYGGQHKFQQDDHWRDYILFHEYFHGDNGAGLGASHQTGWTGLVAEMLQHVPTAKTSKET